MAKYKIYKHTMKLVKLEKISPRKQWNNEQYDFTPWLAENLQQLGDAINMNLEFTSTEVPVGPFFADIVAKEVETNNIVVIENQLEKTNHDHLGKCLTYTSVLGAKTVVWIATKFTDEHRQAFEWLNDNTNSELSFYAIELSLLKVGVDTASVVFDVVASPNKSVKIARTKGELTKNGDLQYKFWQAFRDAIQNDFRNLQTPRPQYWYDLTIGKSNIHISNTYNTNTSTIGCRIYINNAIADTMLPFLEGQKEQIEQDLGFAMQWNPRPDNRDKVIIVDHQFNMEDDQEFKLAVKWLREKTILVHKVFSKAVKNYK